MTAPTATTEALLASLNEAVDALCVRGAGHEVEVLVGVAANLARAVTRLHAVQVVVAERLVETDAASATGWASVKDLLTHLAGGHKGAGGSLVRLAEQTRSLPQLRAAMLTGQVSADQARTIARRVATLPNSPQLRETAAQVMLAQVEHDALDATDLDRAFNDVINHIDPDGTLLGGQGDLPKAERGAHHARHLALVPDEVGGTKISGYACTEDAEIITTTLMAMAAPATTTPGACGGDPATFGLRGPDGRRLDPGCPTPGCTHDGTDPRDHSVRLLDALVELCRRAQAPTHNAQGDQEPLPRAHGTSARISITIPWADLAAQLTQAPDTSTAGTGTGTGAGLLGSGQRLSAHAVRRLACDAEILPAVLGSHSQILDIGRTQRLVTMALWLALVLRDRHCTFPGCTRLPQACEAHHIQHWADGGVTSLDNLALLCRRHHTITHHTPWTISLDPETRRPTWTPPPGLNDPPHHWTYHHPTSPPLRQTGRQTGPQPQQPPLTA